MASTERPSRKMRLRHAIAAALGILVFCAYLALPDSEDEAWRGGSIRDESDEPERLEIVGVLPLDPYPGSSVFIRYAGASEDEQLRVFAGKAELRVIARHAGELVAGLPRDVPPGTVRIRLASAEAPLESGKSVRSKPYFLHVRAASLRKVYSSLLGGIALVALGIGILSRGVREATGLHVARAVTRAARLRSVAYGFGALSGVLAQSTTGAAGVLAALSTSGVLPLGPAALAFVGAQVGAALAPLLVTGLLEPREGLLAVAVGVLWLALGADRRAAALGRLVLGAGLVAFGLQVLKPALEPFVSNPVLLSLADTLHADTVVDLVACALMGTVLVALLQGPAPLVVLIFAVAQTTGRWDLTAALALLAGTGLGASLAALLTASAGSQARRLARLHLWTGAASTLIATCTAVPFARAAEALLGGASDDLGGVARAGIDHAGLPLALAFGACQLTIAVLLALLLPRLVRARAREAAPPSAREARALREELSAVLGLQQSALDALLVLAQTGARSFGRRAEHALADARAALEALVENQTRSASEPSTEPLRRAALACLQLQHAIESLLRRAERVTEARLVEAQEPGSLGLPSDDELLLRELHELVSEGVSAMRKSLAGSEPPDLDDARSREIRINRLESNARRVLQEPGHTPQHVEQHLQLLQVIDAYEVVGNQVYRLTEAMGQSHGVSLA